jgi:hypothetical protein
MVFTGGVERDAVAVVQRESTVISPVDGEAIGEIMGDFTEAGIEAWLAGMDAGPELAAVLASINPMQLGESGRHEMVSSWRRCESWLAAASQASIVAWMDPTDRAIPERAWLRDEMGATNAPLPRRD